MKMPGDLCILINPVTPAGERILKHLDGQTSLTLWVVVDDADVRDRIVEQYPRVIALHHDLRRTTECEELFRTKDLAGYQLAGTCVFGDDGKQFDLLFAFMAGRDRVRIKPVVHVLGPGHVRRAPSGLAKFVPLSYNSLSKIGAVVDAVTGALKL